MAKSTEVIDIETTAGGTEPEKRYRSIKILDRTLARFDKKGAVFTHRGTSLTFKKEGNRLKSITGEGITKTEYRSEKASSPVSKK